jgi:hypothetical protein
MGSSMMSGQDFDAQLQRIQENYARRREGAA